MRLYMRTPERIFSKHDIWEQVGTCITCPLKEPNRSSNFVRCSSSLALEIWGVIEHLDMPNRQGPCGRVLQAGIGSKIMQRSNNTQYRIWIYSVVLQQGTNMWIQNGPVTDCWRMEGTSTVVPNTPATRWNLLGQILQKKTHRDPRSWGTSRGNHTTDSIDSNIAGRGKKT